MTKQEEFYEVIKKEMGVVIATGTEGSVTMRLVSPVVYNGNILIFTEAGSRKYGQMKANPACCIGAGPFYAEAKVEFMGATMEDKNKELRDVYCVKFPGAFDENMEFGGRNAEFLILKPTKLTGWSFANENPAEGEIPTIPFEIAF